MQILVQPDRLSKTHDFKAATADLVYDLRLKDGTSNRYYADVERFSKRLLAEIDSRCGAVLDAYSHYVQIELREALRTRGEYAIEVLMLGLLLHRYAGAAQHTQGLIVALTRGLFRLRHLSSWIKAPADFLRAAVTRVFLMPKIGSEPAPEWRPLQDLPRLINWLRATGEFEQETARLENWRGFLGTLPEVESERCLQASIAQFGWFQQEAARELGCYTQGVPSFLAGEQCRRGMREDQIFCARQPVEYQLNMVAAEIMNRGLRDKFALTSRKVVLVPGCMRGSRASTCRARLDDTDIKCAACDATCPVNQLTRLMHTCRAEVFMVLHSTGFSRWLQRWQREPDCGAVAAACLLNILSGGYEMRARGIASQCVLLDYPGCQKHWDPEGIATALNQERLVQIVTTAPVS